MKSNLIIVTITLICNLVSAQEKEQESYFRSPLDIPLLLAGNFGEIRSNHFHGGLDIKTESVQGKLIYAVADGYISRIKVSPWGYGKTLYITHPNGYVSVYAHLQKYAGEIQNYVKSNQYYKEAYGIELFPRKDQIKVSKGEVVAISGNTGGSSGPHLHFELRSAITGYAVNPLLFGFDIKDNVNPVIKSVRLYPMNKESHVNNYHTPQYYKISGARGNYEVRTKKPIPVFGDVGLAVEVFDFLNGSHNKCGIFSIELQKDGERIYYHEMGSYGFHENRYINSLIDYKEFLRRGKHLQKSFIEPNNKLSIYKEALNRGVVTFNEPATHEMKYIIKDAYGNTSTLKIMVNVYPKVKPELLQLAGDSVNARGNNTAVADLIKTISTPNVNKNTGGAEQMLPVSTYLAPIAIDSLTTSPNFVKKFGYLNENTYATDDVKITIPQYYLYDDLMFEYKTSDTIRGAIAPTHHIHNVFVPVHGRYRISIRVKDIPERLRSKAMVVSVNSAGNTKYIGGAYKNNFISARTKRFGSFTVILDTIPPRIRAVNIYQGKDMTRTNTIAIRMYDGASGIASYNAYINGQWVLMEYEPKNATLTYTFEDVAKFTPVLFKDEEKKDHTFELVVMDNRGNTSKLMLDFKR